MENNFISTSMDVKLDIHDKRPDSLKYKTWTRCQVKIEAIKCLPCFLRVSLKREISVSPSKNQEFEDQNLFSVSINVPGVSVSPATSRTKQHSYGLFWTQNRRDCFIYFGLDTELSCRQHLKWIKKSIRKLELHRQVLLEQRSSRGPAKTLCINKKDLTNDMETKAEETNQYVNFALGPLPKIPHLFDSVNSSYKSLQFVSRASEIYEEICENINEIDKAPRLSRRLSRSSITSGIYEEMKPTASNFIVIDEEPPPLPPLPPHRKRINTFETENSVQLLSDIPRSNTNPESELAKKKKYKTMLDNIFGGARSKRSESVSEGQVCTADEVINCVTPKEHQQQQQQKFQKHQQESGAKSVTFANESIASKRQKKSKKLFAKSKRNSFSSPDLSKINYLDTFVEENVSKFLNNSFTSNDDDLDLSIASLDESSILSEPTDFNERPSAVKFNSRERLNISAKIPNNFNFSACNSSTINLVGSSGATLWQAATMTAAKKNKILIEDLTGYCIMQPISKKTQSVDGRIDVELLKNVEAATSSGNLTGSHCSSIISSTNSIKIEPQSAAEKTVDALKQPINEDSVVYENMRSGEDSNNGSMTDAPTKQTVQKVTAACDFSENCYENLINLEVQAHELKKSSTPTDTLLLPKTTTSKVAAVAETAEEAHENFYQTPRRSIISVDEKVPSYYPNSCDTMKMKRSPPVKMTTSNKSCNEKSQQSSSEHIHNFPSSVKMRHERKEYLYISSPQKIIDQRLNTTKLRSSSTSNCAAQKTDFTVKSTIKNLNLNNNNNNNNNNYNDDDDDDKIMKGKLQKELLQLAFLPKIDFKFDDTKDAHEFQTTTTTTNSKSSSTSTTIGKPILDATNATTTTTNNLLSTTPTSSKLLLTHHSLRLPNRQHHLQVNQDANTGASKTPDESNKKCTNPAKPTQFLSPLATGSSNSQLSIGVKKLASLPRFKKIDFSPLKLKINNVLQRHQQQNQEF